MTNPNPFKGFRSSPEVIRLGEMTYIRFSLLLRNVEDLLQPVVQMVRWCHPGFQFNAPLYKSTSYEAENVRPQFRLLRHLF